MSTSAKINSFITLLLLCTFTMPAARASHIFGGEMTYIYRGDTTILGATKHRYRVILTIYADCSYGQPEAIAQDNPAYLAVYTGATPWSLVIADSVAYSSSVLVSALANSGACGLVSVNLCILKKTFVKDFFLAPSNSGYVVSYQRCCRNSALTNVGQPGDNGVTYTCNIPPVNNTSAVFTNYPPEVLGLNSPLSFNQSATDADGDSLSYELCSALVGATDADTKPFPPGPPPFSAINYISGFSATNPIHASNAFSIDPVTGWLTGTPDQAGLYQVAICCHEWRGGVMISTIHRETEMKVTASHISPYKPDAGGDVTVTIGSLHQFNAVGADSYVWTPATYLDNPNIANPLGHFPDPGIYTYTVTGTSSGGCKGDDVIHVYVMEHSGYVVPAAFTPNNDGKNDILVPIPVGNSTLNSFKIFNRKGNLVYNGGANDPGWDGNYRGIVQDLGTFYWELEYTDNTGKSRRAKGDVTLIR